MHTWSVLAFLAFAAAAVLAAVGKAWPLALVAAGLALTLVPAVFELSG